MIEPFRTLVDKLAALDSWELEPLHAAVTATAEAHELGFGKVGQPIRVAVSGGPTSPPIDVTLQLVGRERALARLQTAIGMMEARAAASN